MRHCVAMNREVSAAECLRIKRELPVHFCGDCRWLNEPPPQEPKRHSRRTNVTMYPYYRVRIPKYVRDLLRKEAEQKGMRMEVLAARIIKNHVKRKEKGND